MTDTRRRVKVYTLNEDRQWDDRGTGHVSSCYVERLKGMSLLVRAESDGSLLLESKINPNTAYQKQQNSELHKLIKPQESQLGTPDLSSKTGDSLHQQKFQATSHKIRLYNCGMEELTRGFCKKKQCYWTN